MRHPTLVILAAGLSNAFGGRKQQTTIGPDGELPYDYTVYDALSCGFGRIVFVVRQDNEKVIKQAFEDRFGVSAPVTFVRQFRPLGTGHAVSSTQGLVNGPFGIANATDLYGGEAMSEHGGVSRAVCRSGPDGRLVSVDEILGIHEHAGGAIVGRYMDVQTPTRPDGRVQAEQRDR